MIEKIIECRKCGYGIDILKLIFKEEGMSFNEDGIEAYHCLNCGDTKQTEFYFEWENCEDKEARNRFEKLAQGKYYPDEMKLQNEQRYLEMRKNEHTRWVVRHALRDPIDHYLSYDETLTLHKTEAAAFLTSEEASEFKKEIVGENEIYYVQVEYFDDYELELNRKYERIK